MKIFRYIYYFCRFFQVFYNFDNNFVKSFPNNMILKGNLKGYKDRFKLVHMDRSFCGLEISKMRRLDCSPRGLRSWSSPVLVF